MNGKTVTWSWGYIAFNQSLRIAEEEKLDNLT